MISRSGEVPRCDGPDHADGFPLAKADQPGNAVRQQISVDLGCPTGVIAEDLDRQGDVHQFRFPEGFAVVQDFEHRELVLVLLQQVGQAPDEPLAPRGRHVPPTVVERIAGRFYRPVDLVRAGHGYLSEHLPGGGVAGQEGVGPVFPFASDEETLGAGSGNRYRDVLLLSYLDFSSIVRPGRESGDRVPGAASGSPAPRRRHRADRWPRWARRCARRRRGGWRPPGRERWPPRWRPTRFPAG